MTHLCEMILAPVRHLELTSILQKEALPSITLPWVAELDERIVHSFLRD
jgi:hypothetical protein